MLDPGAMRETVVVMHTDESGALDYTIKLTFAYHQEAGQWLGVCTELGTPAFAETLEQMQAELKDAVELQLNGMAQLSDVKDYLSDNGVEIMPAKLLKQAGFAIS